MAFLQCFHYKTGSLVLVAVGMGTKIQKVSVTLFVFFYPLLGRFQITKAIAETLLVAIVIVIINDDKIGTPHHRNLKLPNLNFVNQKQHINSSNHVSPQP